jgi:hypothetical protein
VFSLLCRLNSIEVKGDGVNSRKEPINMKLGCGIWSSHGGDCANQYHSVYDAVYFDNWV